MHSKNNNIDIMIQENTDEVIEDYLESLLSRY